MLGEGPPLPPEEEQPPEESVEKTEIKPVAKPEKEHNEEAELESNEESLQQEEAPDEESEPGPEKKDRNSPIKKAAITGSILAAGVVADSVNDRVNTEPKTDAEHSNVLYEENDPKKHMKKTMKDMGIEIPSNTGKEVPLDAEGIEGEENILTAGGGGKLSLSDFKNRPEDVRGYEYLAQYSDSEIYDMGVASIDTFWNQVGGNQSLMMEVVSRIASSNIDDVEKSSLYEKFLKSYSPYTRESHYGDLDLFVATLQAGGVNVEGDQRMLSALGEIVNNDPISILYKSSDEGGLAEQSSVAQLLKDSEDPSVAGLMILREKQNELEAVDKLRTSFFVNDIGSGALTVDGALNIAHSPQEYANYLIQQAMQKSDERIFFELYSMKGDNYTEEEFDVSVRALLPEYKEWEKEMIEDEDEGLDDYVKARKELFIASLE